METTINDLILELDHNLAIIKGYSINQEFSSDEREIEAYKAAIKDLELENISINVSIKQAESVNSKAELALLQQALKEID